LSEQTPARRGGAQQIPRPEVFTSSDSAPWSSGVDWSLDALVASVPLDSAPMLPAFPGSRLSAVLLALTQGDDGVEVLLTRRSMVMRNHRGEVSFPGGRVDEGETPVEAALREAHEEVGLDPAAPTVVGELAHLNTIVSRSYIVPVIATLDHRPELSAQTVEVDRVLWTPLRELTAPGVYHVERWGAPPLDRPLHFFELEDETVWGATAHMLVDLLSATAGAIGPDYR
jgi:8-oxo-dGTP pyrophosphatase MutT (NUDIX family)